MKGVLYSTFKDRQNSEYASLAQYDSILAASSLDDLGSELNRLTSSIGFQNYLYGSHITMPSGEIFQYIFSGYPEKWMNTYLSSNYIHIDPVVDHCFSSNASTPLIWTADIFDTAARKEFMEEAKGNGIASGLSVPLRGRSSELALFSVANPISTRDAQDHNAHSAGAMYVMSSYLHEAIRKLVYSKELISVSPPNLTSKETECLLWWGAGKSANDISKITGISARTVRFHLDNVKGKLGVQTKAQVIARAYQLGIIAP